MACNKVFKFVLIVVLSLFGAKLFAQQSLSIKVRNVASNQAVPEISVTVSNASIGFEKQYGTNTKGIVVVQLPSSGLYNIYATESEMLRSVDTARVNVRSNEAASVEILITDNLINLPAVVLEGTRYSVTSLNTRNAEVSSELKATEVTALPIEGRDITRALFRLPNVSQSTGFYPEAPNVAINGANPLFTNYLIDGFDNNENFLGGMRFNIPVGFTENIQVLTNNYSAEYGNTANGVINITTKMGGNETKGEVFYLTRPGAVVDASSPYVQRDLSGNQVKDGFQRQQFGFGVGGAIKENKTFYFLNFEQTFDLKDNLLNVPELGVNETVRGQNQFSYLSGKIDQFWSEKWHSSVRLNAGRVSIERQGGGLDGGVVFPSAGNQQFRNSFTLANKNEYFGENFTSSTNYQFATFKWDYANPNNPESPNVTVLDPKGQTVAILGHPGYNFNEFESTHQIQQKFTFSRNNHLIKTGAEIKSSGFELYGGGNYNGSYTVSLTQNQLDALVAANLGSNISVTDIPADVQVDNYNVELRPTSFSKRQNIYSLYVEDEWQASSLLAMNFGLRYDYDNLSVGGGNKGDLNNIAPRFSFNFKLNEKSSIRGGYGIFYEKVLYAVWSDAMQFSSDNDDYKLQIQELINLGILPEDTDIDKVVTKGNLGASTNNASYLNGAPGNSFEGLRNSIFSNERRILNPSGYQNPYSHQLVLGYQNQVSKNALFYVDVVHNRSNNLFRLKNLNAPETYHVDPLNVVVRTTAEADQTRPIPIYDNSYARIGDSTVLGVARNIVMTESGGKSRYTAASFTLNKEKADHKYSYRINYTLSRLENNTEDINFRAMDANDFEAEWGPSINDRTHIFNTFISYFPIKGLSVSVASLVQSGQPINRIPDALLYGTTDLNGDGRAFGDAYVGNSDRSPGEERNSDRLPWSNTFDVSVQYSVNSNSNKNYLEFRADVFNLFNSINLSGYSNNATQSNQIQVGSSSSNTLVIRNSAPPRQFQFGVRYVF